MRIVIDLQGAQTESRFRGIGRYCLSLAKAIVLNKGHHEVIIALNGLIPDTIEPVRAAFHGLLPQENIRVWYAPGPVRDCNPANEPAREIAKYIREAFIRNLRPDVVYISSLVEGYIDDAVSSVHLYDQSTPIAATLYDLIPLVDAKNYLANDQRYRDHYLRKVEQFKKSDVLFAISEFSRQEGVNLLDVSADKIVNISAAIDSDFRQLNFEPAGRQALMDKFGISRPFVLYTGGADSRKNLSRLIQAYGGLDPSIRDSHQLVFAGRMPESEIEKYRNLARQNNFGLQDLLVLGYVTDQQLCELYNLCTLFVFPSLHEGFGLPALEAMTCGAPVLASSTSSIPEVVGNPDAMFDPLDTTQITEKMTAALTDSGLRKRLVDVGLGRAELFSWDLSAKNVIRELESRFEGRQLSSEVNSESYGGATLDLNELVQKIGALSCCNEETVDFIAIAKAIDLSLPQQGEGPRLFVDISELVKHDGKSGIQRVVRSLIQEWVHNAPDRFKVVPVYTRPGEFGYRYANEFIHRVFGVDGLDHTDDPIAYRPGDVFLGLDLLLDVLPAQRAYYKAMREHGVKVFFVVYDLLLINFAHCFVGSLKFHYDQWLNTLVHYDGAICISETVANELRDWLALNGPERMRPFSVDWFHLGADIDQSLPSKGLPENPEQRIEILADNPNFLMVGTLEPRKGHIQTLDAFEVLWSQGVDVNLIIIGKHGWLVDALVERLNKHPENGKRLLWLNGVSDEYLEYVYENSTCLIAASEGEGFGLPLIEAAQKGLPIIARDLPVFREVAGDHAFYFEGSTSQTMAVSLRAWLELHACGAHPTSTTMPWLTWKQSAAQLLEAVRRLESLPQARVKSAVDPS